MLLTDFDKQWAESVAGRKLTDSETIELTREYNQWVTQVEQALENGPEMYMETEYE